MSLEDLEDRTMLSVLPAPLVSDTAQMAIPVGGSTAFLNGFSPSVAQNPVNPQKLVEVHNNGTQLLASYSNDGGFSWTGFINVGGVPAMTNVNDLSTNAPFPQLDHATVAIDRGENVYIAAVHHNAGNTSGALVLHRYSFASSTPTASITSSVLQRWHNSDPIYNPIVAVDNNVPSYTDPTTGAVQTDTLAALNGGFAKGLFVAWNTADTAPATGQPNTVFNPNVIRIIGSSNGGVTFTAPQIVNDRGYLESTGGTTPHFSAPQIVFTQGSADGQTPGGQMVVVWNNFGNNTIQVDASRPDAGSATNPAPAVWVTSGATGSIIDAGARVNTATIVNAGTGYSVGSTLTVQSGSGVVVPVPSANANRATLEVTAVGAIVPAAALAPVAGGTGYAVNDVLTVVGGVLATPAAVSAIVASSGIGYAVNDVLTLVGGVVAPGGAATELTVTAVDVTGAVTAVNITNVGLYTTPPTGSIATTGGSTGASGARFNVIFSTVGLATQLTVTAIAAGGIITAAGVTRVGSYAVPPSNPVSVTGGAAAATGATFNLNFGTITAVSITNAGAYLVVPGNPVTTTGGGTNAAFNLTYGGTAGTIPDLATTTTFAANVSITDPNFIVRDLEVTLTLTQPHLNQLRVELVQPVTGTRITLVDNRTNGNNGGTGRGLLDAANLGKLPNNNVFGTTFSDNAARLITDTGATAPYTARFRPEGGPLNQASIVGRTGTDPAISGTWQLVITDFKNDGVTPTVVQSVNSWSLRFSDISSSTNAAGGFGTDLNVTSVPSNTSSGQNRMLTGTATGNVGTPYPMVTSASGPAGIGPSVTIAIDNTLGSFSPFQGRLYIGYAAVGGGGTNTDVYLTSGDFTGGSISWNSGIRVNDDTASDNFSEGIRPQFLPTVAVDQTTGTVGVMYYDARYDASLVRVATSFRASIDGGQTFSPNVFVSQPKTALNALDTTQTIFIEPIPGNQGQAGTFGFGDRQSLIMWAGKAVPVFSSNLNAAGAFLQTAQVRFAAGPRIIQGDMGPVQPISGFNTLAADGRRQFNAFEVTFDRPIDATSFTTSDVTVIYKDPNGVDTTLPVASVTRLNGPSFSFGVRTIGTSAKPLATRFRVVLATAQTGPGTYRYVIGSDINDLMRTPSSVALGGGGALATLTTLTGDVGNTDFNMATTPTFAPVTADQLVFSTTGNVHSHSGAMDFFVEVHNVSTGLWTEIFRQTLNNSAQFNFDGLVINFAPQLIDQVRLNSNPFQQQSYHSWGSMVLAVNAAGTQVSAVAPDINLVVPPTGTGGTLGGVVWPTPPASNADTTVSTIAVSGLTSAITDLNVKVQLNHASNADVAMRLVAPNGAAAVLTLHRGGSGVANGFANTTFDDEALLTLTGSIAPYTLVMPEQSLSVFDGMTPAVANGNWVLQINDDTAGNTGTLVGWSLVFNSAIGTPLVQNPGNLMDQNNNSITNQGGSDRFAVPQSVSGVPFLLPYAKDSLPLMLAGPHIVSSSVPNNPSSTDNRVINTVNDKIDVTFDRDILVSTFTPANVIQLMSPSGAIPLPAGSVTVTALNPIGSPLRARSFRVTFPPQALSGSYNLIFSPTMTDIDGNQVDSSLNAGLDVLRGASSAPGSVKVQYPASAVPVTLNPGQTVNATLSIPDSFLIQQSAAAHIQIQLKIAHQNIPDLEAQLIAPDSTTVQLFRNVGTFGTSPNADMNDTILDDFATIPIQNVGTPIGTGPFNPQLPLSVLNGRGVNGTWTLSISNRGVLSGTLDQWSLFLPKSTPSTGLGELIADQFSVSFRIFTQDPANALTTNTWTAIGPAAENSGGNSGRIGGLAVDPSDPSGNTVFVAGASGGVWKTTNFLTTAASGPTYVPLTDFGPAVSINTGSLAVFGRSNDPSQSIVFVATGEGDTNSPGVGFLRSMDGGRTWQVLDSTNNVDAANPANPSDPDKIARMSSPARDHVFVNATGFKVIVDPTPLPNGQVAVYAALSGSAANGGIWRSLDTGKTWTRIRAGNATDVVLAAGSRNASGNLDKLYAAFRGEGVYFTPSAISANTMGLMAGGAGAPIRRDVDVMVPVPIPVSNPASTPNGNFGRIVLATPVLTNNPLQDTVYQGWLYALVVTTSSTLQGLYLTKDFGANWTNVRIPRNSPTLTTVFGTNDETKIDYDPFSAQGNYNVSFAIDPNNPNVVYIGGSRFARSTGTPVGMIRVDVTTLSDPYALVAYDNSDPGAGLIQFTANSGPMSTKVSGTSTTTGFPLGVGQEYGILDSSGTARPGAVFNGNPGGYFNLQRDPDAPFSTPSSLRFTNVANFNNGGDDAHWMPFEGALAGSGNHHDLVTFRDPLTGMTRLIFGGDSGVFTGVDRGDGTIVSSVGSAPLSVGTRNGNLQLMPFIYGAAQPSTLAADIANAMFYGNGFTNGNPTSTATLLQTGELNWNGPGGTAAGIATDQTGSGTYYTYRAPCCGGSNPLPTDFFMIQSPGGPLVSRMGGPGASLIQPGDDPTTSAGQWPFGGGANFAVNPIDGSGLLISGVNGGIIYRTTDMGLNWFKVGNTANGDVDGTYAPALAFGAPSTAVPGVTNDFIYAGTTAGNIFVTFNGGGVGQWRNISTGLDGSRVQVIVPNPRPDSKEVYAVTSNGVYWMQDASAASPTWVRLNNVAGQGNIFNVNLTVFGNRGDVAPILRGGSITSLAVDWRWAIPDAAGTHPVLYVGGQGGVVRSTDKGVTWRPFPEGTDEQQTITIPSTVTSLTFNYNGAAALPLAFSPATTATEIRLNLETIAALNGNVSVTGPTGGPYVVTFINQLGAGDIIPLTVTGVVPGGNISIVETNRGAAIGGYLPVARVVDLDLVLGNINPATGFPDESAGLNMLVAFTDGRSAFAIRLDNSAIAPFAVTPRDGPRVLTASPAGNSISLTLSGPVDSRSFTTADVVQNERQTITVTPPVTSVTFSYNGTSATTPLAYSAATTAVELQDHLKTIPALLTNEAQTVIISGGVSSVVFSFNGTAATALNFTLLTTAAQLRANLETTPALAGNVAVTGSPGGPYVVTFNNALAGKDVPSLLANSGGVTVKETFKGGPNFRVTGPAGGPYIVDFFKQLAGQDVALLISTWVQAGSVDAVETVPGGSLGLLGPSGNPLVPTSIVETSFGTPNPHNAFRINIPSSGPGFYSLVVGPGVSDFSGNRMDQDQDIVNGEISDDMFSTRLLLQSFGNSRPVVGAAIQAPNPNPALPAILENDFTNTGVDLASWLAGLPAGAISDPNDPSYGGQAPRGIAVTNVDNANGRWQYAIDVYDSDPFWFDFGAPTATSAVFLEASSATRIRFVPNVNYNSTSGFYSGGQPSFAFRAWDLTQGTPGGIGDTTTMSASSAGSVSTASATAVITVTDVNDPPSFIPGSNVTVNEDAGPQTVLSWATAILPYPAAPAAPAFDEASQTLTFIVSLISSSGGLTFASAPAIDASTGDLTFEPDADASGSATFSVVLTDNGSGTPPNNNTSLAQTFTITVNAANDAPTFTLPANPPTIDEDAGAQTVLGFATAISAGAPNESFQVLTFTVTPTGSTGGLTFSTAPTIDPLTGNLAYQAAADSSGTATFSVTLRDSGPGGPPPNANTSAAQTFTITVNAINDPPTFNLAGNPPAVDEDAPLQTVNNFATALSLGPPNESGQSFVAFTVTMTGSTGGLTFSTAPSISTTTGALTYQPAPNANGTATFDVTLTDDGPNSPAPNSNTSAVRTFTITVNPVNDAPTFTLAGNPPAVDEDAGAQSVANFATGLSTGPANESGQTRVGFTVTQTGSSGGLTFTTAPAIDVLTGALTYQAAPDANGTATFSVTLTDSGSGAPPNVNTSAPQSFTITVNSINDAPSFNLPASTTSNEDAGLQTVSGFATAISAGAANESSQTLTFILTPTGSTGGLTFSTAPSINAAGTLTYQATADASGTATFDVVLTDDGPGAPPPNANTSVTRTITIIVNAVNDAPTFTLAGNPPAVDEGAGPQSIANFASAMSAGPPNESGQTLNPFVVAQTGTTGGLVFTTAPAIDLSTGRLTYEARFDSSGTATFNVTLSDSGPGAPPPNANTSTPRTFTITVNAINNAPSFTLSGNPPAVNEDSGAQTVANFATAISAGPANESGQVLTFTVTQTGSTGGLTFAAAPAIDPLTGELTYTTALNANGTATFSVVLSDDGPGAPPPNSNNSAAQTFTITVLAVNDAPTFNLAANPIVAEDAGAQTIAGFASAMSVGPADESAQMLTGFTVTQTGATDGLTFTTAPAIDLLTGNLTFQAAADANGTATFNVTLADDGPNAPAPNTNTSTPRTFTITVNAINDVPSFALSGNPPAVIEDAGTQTVPNFATAISAGPPNESSQTLTFLLTPTGSTGNLTFATGPAIDPITGALTYRTAANANGTASFDVRLMDSGPGTSPNVNTSAAQSFTITVNSINDAPTFTLAGNPPAANEDAGLQTVANFATAISAGAPDESGQTLTFTVTPTASTGGLTFAQAPAIDPLTGTLTYAADPDTNGTATFDVILSDNGPGGPAPNANTSVVQTFTITVTAVNDAPTFTLAGDPPTIVLNSGPQTVPDFALGMSVGPANESAQTLVGFTVIPTGGTGALTFAALPAIDVATGALTYEAASTGFGTATFDVVLVDSGPGGPPPNVNASAAHSFTISVLRPSSVDAGATPAPAFFGQSSSLSVSVIVLLGGTPTGTVTVIDTFGGQATTLASDVSLAGGVVSGGTVTISIPLGSLSAGDHTLQISYSGDTDFAPSAADVEYTVNQAVTQTVLSPTATAFYGETVTFTATVNVTSPGTPGTPTDGTVVFMDNNVDLGSANLSGDNVATFTTLATQLASGSHSITAVYLGSADFAVSPASVARAQNISKATTQTVLTDPTPSSYGNPVTFTATVQATSPGAPDTPVGSVTFKRGAAILGTGIIDPASGQATFTTSPTQLTVGNSSITAVFNGSDNFAASPTSPAKIQVVNRAGTVVALSSSQPAGTAFGQSVTFTALVGIASGGAPGTPTGSITFRDGATILKTVALINGQATFTTSTLSANPAHSISATYNPTALFAASDETITQLVNQAATTTVLSSSTAVWAANRTLRFSAMVTSATGLIPVGAVVFTVTGPSGYSFSTPAVRLSAGGKANSPVYRFPATVGDYTVTANYVPATGPQNFAPNSAASATQTQSVRIATAMSLRAAATTRGVTLTSVLASSPRGFGIPPGPVSFYERLSNGDKVLLGTVGVNSSGVASLFVSTLAAGRHIIVAEYAGDDSFIGNTRIIAANGRITGRLV